SRSRRAASDLCSRATRKIAELSGPTSKLGRPSTGASVAGKVVRPIKRAPTSGATRSAGSLSHELYVIATDDGASSRIIRVGDGPHGLRPARTARSERPGELCEQGPDAGVDLVADGSDVVGGPVGRVGQLPVQVALAG